VGEGNDGGSRCKQTRMEKNTSSYFERKKELKGIKKQLPQYKATNKLNNQKKNQLLKKL
jgi:hypothetical protein